MMTNIVTYWVETGHQNVLRAGFEPATYGYLYTPLQSTVLPTELPEDGGEWRTM